MEATKVPGGKFKSMFIRMHKDLRRKMNALSKNLNKEIVSIKNH